MAKENSTLLFIPDISGFTEFVNNTEINHSRHIIAELLEIIINSDKTNMSVSEIEGDAVLFYKDEIPSVKDLIEQCKITFQNFHNHLVRYNSERICRCGACETAANLSLKFIIHAGDVQKISIKDHQKLHGADVILAHRLLKNSINSSEYILICDNIEFKAENLQNSFEWVNINSGKDEFENVGEVKYSYTTLEGLQSMISDPKSIQFPDLGKQKIQFSNSIKAPLDVVYENFTDFDKRLEWNEDIKDIILHDRNLNSQGAIHTCLVGNDQLDIETIGRLEENNKITYGERLNSFKGIEDLVSIYTFENNGSETIINAEIDFKPTSFFKKLFKSIIKKFIQKQNEKALERLKSVIENDQN